MTFQVGANANETISLSIADLSTTALKGTLIDVNVATAAQITTALEKLNGKPASGGTAATAGENLEIEVGGITLAIETTDAMFSILGTVTAEGLVAEINEVILRDSAAKGIGSVALDDAGNMVFTGNEIDVEFTSDGATMAKTVAREMTVDQIDVSSAANSQQAVQILDSALATVDDYRADIGAVQNRLESTIDNLSNINENLTTSQSRIVDVDFAKETSAMTKDQMKMQAGMSRNGTSQGHEPVRSTNAGLIADLIISRRVHQKAQNPKAGFLQESSLFLFLRIKNVCK